MELLGEAGGFRWNIPREFGGTGVDAVELLEIYRELATGSLLTTFILTQRNAACQRIETSSNRAVAARLLPLLGQNRLFATVGISHLTTSRQHLREPAVVAADHPQERGYRLNGQVPWVSCALVADLIVTGGTLGDGRQILAVIPRDRFGVTIERPVSLLGLSAAQTCLLNLHDVAVSYEEILHGPAERVMTVGSGGGAGSLATSAVAVGTAQGTLMMFAEEADQRPELVEFLTPLQGEAQDLAERIRRAAAGLGIDGMDSPESIRQRANSLALRAAQAWLASTKGTGYTCGHPAERAVRESLFFLVWSCPQTVLQATLRQLSNPDTIR